MSSWEPEACTKQKQRGILPFLDRLQLGCFFESHKGGHDLTGKTEGI